MFSHQDKRNYKSGKFIRFVLGILILLVVLGFVIQFFFFFSLAAMFELPTISYWQSLGLFILVKLFFGVGPLSRGRRFMYRRHHGRKHLVDSDDRPVSIRKETFQKYWQEEGKEAYEAFRAKNGVDPEDGKPGDE